MNPTGCDTLVAVGTATTTGATVFGKNSDRPEEEVQNVVHVPARQHPEGAVVQCTHVNIPQVPETRAVFLSQPYWMWGAEMGANDAGVVIGNEAVWTKEPLRPTGLLGMDLLRLGLERAGTARAALDVITGLLERHGQGGACALGGHMEYHNSFLIADATEAWVLETADEWWIAERVTDGVRNISNGLSIRDAGTLRREGVVAHALARGYCATEAEFNFARCFSQGYSKKVSPRSREGRAQVLLDQLRGEVTPVAMMGVLRDHEGGLCMHGGFLSAGSQVSVLAPGHAVHWFTGTAPPCASAFLPYAFPADPSTPSTLAGLVADGPHSAVDAAWPWVRHRAWQAARADPTNTAEFVVLQDRETAVATRFEAPARVVDLGEEVRRANRALGIAREKILEPSRA